MIREFVREIHLELGQRGRVCQSIADFSDSHIWDSVQRPWAMELELAQVFPIETCLGFFHPQVCDLVGASTHFDPEILQRVNVPNALPKGIYAFVSDLVVPVTAQFKAKTKREPKPKETSGIK